jgi:hypothetical protein
VSPSSGAGYNLVVGSPGYASVVYTNVPVATATSTAVPRTVLTASAIRSITGTVSPVSLENAAVQALQRVVDNAGDTSDLLIQADYANADATTGTYEVSVPQGATTVVPFGGSGSIGANAGIYRVSAQVGSQTRTAEADVTLGNDIVDLTF